MTHSSRKECDLAWGQVGSPMEDWKTFETFSDATQAARALAADMNQAVSISSGYLSELMAFCGNCHPDGWQGPKPGEKLVWFVAWSMPKESKQEESRLERRVGPNFGAIRGRDTHAMESERNKTLRDYPRPRGLPAEALADSEGNLILDELLSDSEDFARADEDGWPYSDENNWNDL